MYNVLIDKNISLLYESLEGLSNNKLYSGRDISNKDLIDFNCNILFTRSQTKVNYELLKRTNVQLVATATSGTEHIDLEYLNANNIKFIDAKGSNANSVAEFVIYSIIKWALFNNYNLSDKTVAIIGYGSIGKIVAYYASKLKLKILVYDMPLIDNNYTFPNYIEYRDLEFIFSNADIITTHTPLIKEGKYKTYHLIDERLIAKLKNNSIIIHHSRGGIIDENSLIKYKKNKNLYYSIDVWENEPNFNKRLAEISEITTPHISGHSYDGKLNGSLILLKAFEEFTNILPNYSIIENEIKLSNKKDIESFENINQLFNYIENNRKFEEDNINFKHIIDIKQSALKFDLLRRDYPIKRECLTSFL